MAAMSKRIIAVNLVDHKEQRYDTFADWEGAPGEGLLITVSDVHDDRYHYLSAIHELLEAILCLHHGITQQDVDAFDIPYETARMAGGKHAACGCLITNDPGSDIHAPYRAEHLYATSVEYGLAALLGVDAAEYDQAFIALDGGVRAPKAR
jgi:hypothetical protein